MELPKELTRELQSILQGEYPLFQAAMGAAPHGGLRFNALKLPENPWLDLELKEKVPWTELGFYSENKELAKHPYHHGGVFYIQEPSAMAPAEILRPQKGNWVLDLCAAPGGKATRLAEFLEGSGFILANDISNSRCKGLLRNMERFTMTNSAVTNESPERLADHFGPAFNRVLVDAPCSGQGMFRREPKLLKEYITKEHRPYCQWQRDILSAAADLTVEGGEVVYSTCTFSREENEEIIAWFLREHPEFYPINIPLKNGFRPGVDSMPGTVRLWPHHLKGEGHFIAHLGKKGETTGKALSQPQAYSLKGEDTMAFEEFLKANGVKYPQGHIFRRKNSLYLTNGQVPDCHGLKLVGRGLYLGDIKGERFVPSHPWALSLTGKDVTAHVDFALTD
ncbi:MAG: RsmF rRNA methyltransferase first C-terminal domain-containing protein, partial [Bacillota bacterium]|nr:RsmF rRNA methyltransferase first C-terminal domain-containing protein [Bacillota bacterium]